MARHFKIHYRKWQWLTSTGYADFLRWYDGTEGVERPPDYAPSTWHRCYSSDMLRASETAGKLADVPATFMPLLREIPQAPVYDTSLKLPLIVWHVLSRIAWWFDHSSQLEGRTASRQRARRIIEFLRRQPEQDNILIVTHGFLMYVLRQEMRRAGFAGQIATHPRCGHVYLLERPTGLDAPATAPGEVAGQPASVSQSPVVRWRTLA